MVHYNTCVDCIGCDFGILNRDFWYFLTIFKKIMTGPYYIMLPNMDYYSNIDV